MKKVALIGYAESRKEFNPEKYDGEIWIMNDMADIYDKFDRIFDIHDDENIINRVTRREGLNLVEMFEGLEKPIYMQHKWDNIPYSVEYPIAEIEKEFYKCNAMGNHLFLTCSPAYMLALAIYEKFEQIELYGIDLAVDGEFKDELPGVLFWLGQAAGRGINIIIAKSSPLLKAFYRYGYDEPEKKQVNKYINFELQRISQIKETAIDIQQKYRDEMNKCIGAETILEHLKKLINDI
jgi:hypothetical protein